MKGGCRPCDQPHFFVGDTPTTKLDHGLLVADYPIKDWNTGKPKALVAKAGEQYVVTGTFAINSIGGFAASDGLIIHKKFQDASGKVITEGNAVLPPDAQDDQARGQGRRRRSAAPASTPRRSKARSSRGISLTDAVGTARVLSVAPRTAIGGAVRATDGDPRAARTAGLRPDALRACAATLRAASGAATARPSAWWRCAARRTRTTRDAPRAQGAVRVQVYSSPRSRSDPSSSPRRWPTSCWRVRVMA